MTTDTCEKNMVCMYIIVYICACFMVNTSRASHLFDAFFFLGIGVSSSYGVSELEYFLTVLWSIPRNLARSDDAHPCVSGHELGTGYC